MPISLSLGTGISDFRANSNFDFSSLGTLDVGATTEHGWYGAWTTSASEQENIIISSENAVGDLLIGSTSSNGEAVGVGNTVKLSWSFLCWNDPASTVGDVINTNIDGLFVQLENEDAFGSGLNNIVWGVLPPYADSNAFNKGTHYYAFTADASTGTLKIYRDGTLITTASLNNPGTINTSSLIWRYAGAVGALLNPSNVTFSKITAYRGIFSTYTIARLATGALPDSSGVL